MKYFTKEWYKELQTESFIRFHETEEEFNEMVKNLAEHGIDYKNMNRENLEAEKLNLLNYLPESIHPYINNGTLNTEYPNDELKRLAKEWLDYINQKHEAIEKSYFEYYDSIVDVLPEQIHQFLENPLHDTRILAYESLTDDVFVMELDCSGGFSYFRDIKVTFKGVTNLLVPNDLIDAFWLYDEIYLTESGYTLEVLFDIPLTEFSITFSEVLVEIIN